MVSRKGLTSAALLFAASMSFNSCGFLQDCMDCLCGDITSGTAGVTGNPKVDSFFAAVIALDQSTTFANTKMENALADLRAVLGLSETATVAEIRTAIDAAWSDASITFTASYDPAVCRADVDVAARAAAECDVSVDPGEVDIVCQGHCEGTCSGGCTGECRLPSVSAYCEGACHGSCWLDVSATCYGTCHGTCSGTCSVPDGAQCAGSCDGTCTGQCEAAVEGGCAGECHGECTISATPGECSGHCEASCTGSCEGSCEGTIEPPTVDADCQASVEARVEASVECDPPEFDFGVDTSGVANIVAITEALGRVAAVSAEAGAIREALNAYVTTLNTAAQAIFQGELGSTDLACALQQLTASQAILANSLATLNYIMSIEVTLML